MPMPGGPELSTTARTVQITDDDALAAMIADVQHDAIAAGRAPIDIQWTYTEPSLRDPTVDVDRHLEAFDRYRKMGVTSLVISCKTDNAAATLEFIEAFGAAYLR
jgi:hypothetical protein